MWKLSCSFTLATCNHVLSSHLYLRVLFSSLASFTRPPFCFGHQEPVGHLVFLPEMLNTKVNAKMNGSGTNESETLFRQGRIQF